MEKTNENIKCLLFQKNKKKQLITIKKIKHQHHLK